VEYVEEFEKLSGSISHLDPNILMGIFINGLIGPIKAAIKGLELGSLAAIKDRAIVLEERNLEWKKSGVGQMDCGGGVPQSSTSFHRVGIPASEGLVREPMGSKGAPLTQISRAATITKLSTEELQEQSRRGLCFKCGERWGQNHICKFRNFNVALLEAYDNELEESKNEMVEEEADEAFPVVELKTLCLGFNSMQGFITKNRSFKVIGRIEEKEVVVLIDTRAEVNFLSRGLAQQL